MAGPFSVQRTPRGLLNVIGNYGGETPPELAAQVVTMLDGLQFFAAQQQQSQFVQNAAIASGATLSVTVPSTEYWLLIHCFARCVEQAAMTFLDMRVALDPNVSTVAYATKDAAFVAGRVRALPFVPPAGPYLLMPGQRITVSAAFAGVANADLSLNAVVGVLG